MKREGKVSTVQFFITSAILREDPEIWKWILERKDFPITSSQLDDALRGLVKGGGKVAQISAVLLQKGANVNQTLDDGKSLVVKAADDGKTELLSNLLRYRPRLPDCYGNAETAVTKWDFNGYSYWIEMARKLNIQNLGKEKSLDLIASREREKKRLADEEEERRQTQRRLAEAERQREIDEHPAPINPAPSQASSNSNSGGNTSWEFWKKTSDFGGLMIDWYKVHCPGGKTGNMQFTSTKGKDISPKPWCRGICFITFSSAKEAADAECSAIR